MAELIALGEAETVPNNATLLIGVVLDPIEANEALAAQGCAAMRSAQRRGGPEVARPR